MDVESILSAEERRDLLLSVGTHRGGRRLTPVGVGELFEKVVKAGGSLKDCARVAGLNGTMMVARFRRLLELPESIRDLVDWGRGRGQGKIAFAVAAELARLRNVADEEAVVRGALEHGLSGSEVRGIVQLRMRSARPVQECVKEVVGMRPRVERRYVYFGAVTDAVVRKAVARMAEEQRDALLGRAVKDVLGLGDVWVARLGAGRFTLVGGAGFGSALKERGESLEREVNDALREARN